MESDLTQSTLFYKLVSWGDKNKKLVLGILVVLVIVGIGIAFWFSHQNDEQIAANAALSKLTNQEMTPSESGPAPEALLNIAASYPGTDAAQRAELLAAGALFESGKYDDAQVQFGKFVQNHTDSPFMAQAVFGLAACLDAEGKTNDAVTKYKDVVDHYPQENVAASAKMALARLMEGQGKYDDARNYLEEVARGYPAPTSSEAAQQLQQLNAAHPEVAPTNAPAAMGSPMLNLKKP